MSSAEWHTRPPNPAFRKKWKRGARWGVYSRRAGTKPNGPYHWTVRRVVMGESTTWMIDRSADARCDHGEGVGAGDRRKPMWCFRDVRTAMAFVAYLRRKARLLREQWSKSEQTVTLARAAVRKEAIR